MDGEGGVSIYTYRYNINVYSRTQARTHLSHASTLNNRQSGLRPDKPTAMDFLSKEVKGGESSWSFAIVLPLSVYLKPHTTKLACFFVCVSA